MRARESFLSIDATGSSRARTRDKEKIVSTEANPTTRVSIEHEGSEESVLTPPTAVELGPTLRRITVRWRHPETIRLIDGFDDLPAAVKDDARNQGYDYRNEIGCVFHITL